VKTFSTEWKDFHIGRPESLLFGRYFWVKNRRFAKWWRICYNSGVVHGKAGKTGGNRVEKAACAQIISAGYAL
jgi:hypothetical protein